MLPDDFDEKKAGLTLPAGFTGQPVICDGGETSLMATMGDFRQPMKEVFGEGYVPGL